MDGVQKLVKEALKEPLKQLGFKTRNFNFYRQVNGVVQGFKIYANFHYTIRYNMFPLVRGVSFDNYVFEGKEIAKLTVPQRDTFLHVIPWGSDVTEQNQIDAWDNRYETYKDIARQLVQEVNDFLIPHFQEYNTPAKNLELHQRDPFGQITSALWWSMQGRNDTDAYCYLVEAIREEQRTYCREHLLRQLQELKALFDAKDPVAIEKYIEQKEAITLQSFALKK